MKCYKIEPVWPHRFYWKAVYRDETLDIGYDFYNTDRLLPTWSSDLIVDVEEETNGFRFGRMLDSVIACSREVKDAVEPAFSDYVEFLPITVIYKRTKRTDLTCSFLHILNRRKQMPSATIAGREGVFPEVPKDLAESCPIFKIGIYTIVREDFKAVLEKAGHLGIAFSDTVLV